MAWTLTHRIFMILHFLTFWSYISFWFSGHNVLVTIFENVHRPCKHHFIIVNNSLYHAYSFLLHFLAIFTSVIIFRNVHRPCKQHINIITKSLHHVYSFLLIFPKFLAIFAWIAILDNAHRPYKQYINIVDSSLCHATLFFPDLFLVFWAYLHHLSY